MLLCDDIKVEFESQGFKATHMGLNPNNDKVVLFMESMQKTDMMRCPICGASVHMHENTQITIKDILLYTETKQYVSCFCHRYMCTKCKHTFTEKLPFVYPGTRITNRAANWIKGFLQNKLSIRAIQNLTGIHWDTIRKVQQEVMETALLERKQELKSSGLRRDILR